MRSGETGFNAFVGLGWRRVGDSIAAVDGGLDPGEKITSLEKHHKSDEKEIS